MSSYLHSAARALEQILSEMHPEYDWTVSVRPEHLPEGEGDAPAAVGLHEPGAARDDSDTVFDRDTPAAPDGGDDDALEEAA